ncbi:MAG TPA: T9SS type A sorting domain-containing protein, partial [candidate division Zixibacteria bacterium]|nr:T9SS type A sorting domain-containing protein [candidate division Zixibacteria bacterium]
LDVNEQHSDLLPAQFELSQNYPNPFNPTTLFSFSVPTASHVVLDVYNVAGQRVATLADDYYKAGMYSVSWDAAEFASGVYFYKMDAGKYSEVKKMVLLK